MRKLLLISVILSVLGTGCSSCIDDKDKNYGVAPAPTTTVLRNGKMRTYVFLDAGAGGGADQ